MARDSNRDFISDRFPTVEGVELEFRCSYGDVTPRGNMSKFIFGDEVHFLGKVKETTLVRKIPFILVKL